MWRRWRISTGNVIDLPSSYDHSLQTPISFRKESILPTGHHLFTAVGQTPQPQVKSRHLLSAKPLTFPSPNQARDASENGKGFD